MKSIGLEDARKNVDSLMLLDNKIINLTLNELAAKFDPSYKENINIQSTL